MDGSLSSCSHCGLPAARGARFCCYGCELAARVRAEAGDDQAGLFGTLSFTLVLSMAVMMLSLFLYAEDVFDASADRELAWMRAAYRWAALFLSTPVMALAGLPLLRRAASQARALRPSMDALVVLGSFAAYGLSIQHLLAGSGGVYFDSATAAIVLATFGRYLEAAARSRACRSLGPLVEVSRAPARLVADDGTRTEIAAAEVEPGMRIEVPADHAVPADLVLEGEAAELDLAVLTGESRPVLVAPGETAMAGAVPVGRGIVGRAVRRAEDSALERLSALARSLAERPSALLRWADRFAGALTPVIAVLALATFAYWTRTAGPSRGVTTALAVVLAACPCSYAIASPLVHWLTLRRAFAKGVLVRSPLVLEALAHTRVVAFDKTGTLGRPDLCVASELLAPGTGRAEVLGLVRALEESCTHPAARALLRHAGEAEPAAVEARRFVPGSGVTARTRKGAELFLGAGEEGALVLTRDGREMARFTLEEELRPEACEAVEQLRGLSLRVVVLSGDDAARVSRLARRIGAPFEGSLGPEQKIARLEALGDHVAMVGDGVNDVPALAGRLTSFTLGGAAPLAKGVAQVTLLSPDLRLVPWTIALARRCRRLVKSLLAFSTAYNVVFVALAATGALTPVWAGLSMLVASLLALAVAVGLGAEGGEAAEDAAGLAEPAGREAGSTAGAPVPATSATTGI